MPKQFSGDVFDLLMQGMADDADDADMEKVMMANLKRFYKEGDDGSVDADPA